MCTLYIYYNSNLHPYCTLYTLALKPQINRHLEIKLVQYPFQAHIYWRPHYIDCQVDLGPYKSYILLNYYTCTGVHCMPIYPYKLQIIHLYLAQVCLPLKQVHTVQVHCTGVLYRCNVGRPTISRAYDNNACYSYWGHGQ